MRLDDNIGDLCYSSSSADSVQIAKVLYLQKVKGEPIDRLHSSDDDYCPCPTKKHPIVGCGRADGCPITYVQSKGEPAVNAVKLRPQQPRPLLRTVMVAWAC